MDFLKNIFPTIIGLAVLGVGVMTGIEDMMTFGGFITFMGLVYYARE